MRIGMIGMGLMGTVHSRALRDAVTRFGNGGSPVRLVVCADPAAGQTELARRLFGYERTTAEWREAVEADDVDVVMVCTPNATHLPIIEAAAAAGKHVFCEKPVGRSPAETVRIADICAEADVRSMVGYVYRWAPMVQHARQLIASGQIGAVTHFRSRFLVGYASDPSTPLSWRFDGATAGFGALGDLMSHVIDMAHFQAGPIREVVGDSHRFIQSRPLPMQTESSVFGAQASTSSGQVTNEDYAAALVGFDNGARGVLEACRVINGPECQMAFDIHGTKGAISWNFERLNELWVHRDSDGEGTRLIRSGPQHPGHSRFYPGEGVGLGYEDLAAIQAGAMIEHMTGGRDEAPTLSDAAAVARVQSAIADSWDRSRQTFVPVAHHPQA